MSSSTAGQGAGQLETRGIEPVPEAECDGHPLQLFWVWFAANISILGLPLGATLVAFRGLSIWQVLLVAFLGSVGSFAVVGLISVAGRRGGLPASRCHGRSSGCGVILARPWCRCCPGWAGKR